ncbi:MAG: hypothetical protein AB1757_07335 [Acidobacteriota bacterium]
MTLFSIANRNFGWDEIRIAATVWNEWQSFFEQTRQALACLCQAEKRHQLPQAFDLREAAQAFRYAHNLISAEETNIWLRRWHMTVEDWMNCLRSECLRKRFAGQLDELVAAHPVSDEAVAGVIKHYAICTDNLRHWAFKLAGRAAVAASANQFFTIESPDNLIAYIETEFARQQKQAVTPKLIESKIANHRLDWVRFDCRYLWFAEERVAREAAWCVSEDGMTLDEVAHDAHNQIKPWTVYADEIDLKVRPYFLAARQGDLLGPLNIWQGFPLFSLLNKQLPAADDSQVHARAEQAIIANFTEQAMRERVQWLA